MKWIISPDGVIALADGRQLYVNYAGWCGAVREDTHTNTDGTRRRWTFLPDGTIALAYGHRGERLHHGHRQLYANHDGWCCAAADGKHANTSPHRRHWKVLQM